MTSFYATIARYYDSEHYDKEEDYPLYSELAEEMGSPILIIGSGTGRLMIHLAEEGHTVHGIEIEQAMLERAQHKRDALPHLKNRLFFHHGDALKFSLDMPFPLVIIPYNTLMHFLSLEEQKALLKRARGALAPGGLVVIDLPNAGEAFASQDTEAVILERTFLERETGHLVMQHSVSRLDRVEQVMYVTWIYDEVRADRVVERTLVPMTIHYFFLSEIRLLLEACGFEVDAVYGDFDRSPFEDGAPRMVVLAK
jgi:SAM-dependent methyltransferase